MKNDPYAKLADSISRLVIKLADMICWVASRTLSKKEFAEFIEYFEHDYDKEKKR